MCTSNRVMLGASMYQSRLFLNLSILFINPGLA